LRITFDVRNTGLGNNGGTLTLIKSANTLISLGNTVVFIDSGKNQHTWNKLNAEHIVVKNIEDIPTADVVISTGFKSVPLTVSLPERCGKLKVHYIRGWETWKYSEDQIVKQILTARTIKFVNSIGLYNKLANYNVKSFIVRPGNDFDDFSPLNQRDDKNIVLGGLFHSKHKTKRTDWILDTAQTLKKRFKTVKLYMFGVDKDPFFNVINRYVHQPTVKEKNLFYNQVHIWLSPSCLEGLHIVPQEAMLTECPVVCPDTPLNGTEDYLQNQLTGIVSKDNIFDFVRSVETLVKNPMLRIHLGKSGRNQILKLGNRELNMKILTSILEGLLSGTIEYTY
jgi:glycosyltransferase involved in cell wall biosynthesis